MEPNSTSSPEGQTSAEDRGSRTSRWMRRASYVAAVFVKFGFASVLHSVALDRFLRRRDKPGEKADAATAGLEIPVRLRLALEEIGATAIKVGQVLSTRPDLLPPDYIQELRKLQEEVPPFSFEQVEQILEEELGAPVEELFAEFDPEPLGSASLSQVHAAKLPNGRKVAVKVQRPEVAELVETDLAVMRWGARQASKYSQWAREQNLTDWVDEIARILRHELDFVREAYNAERMRENLSDEPRALVPRVFEDYTTRRVLTSQLITGASINQEEELAKLDIDRTQLAQAFAQIMLRQTITDGFFHGDPHGGNLKITPDGRIAFFDFGHMGTAGPQLRNSILQIINAVVNGDTDEMLAIITSVGVIGEQTDLRVLRLDIDKQMSQYWGASAGQIAMAEIIEDLLGLLLRYNIRMPPAWISLLRAMTISEGVCLQLDPDFDFQAVATEAAREMMLEQFRPANVLRSLGQLARELNQYALRLPRQLSQLLLRVQASGLKVQLQLAEADRPLRKLDTMVNRLAFSIIAAAIIMASAIIFSSEQALTILGRPFITVLAVVGIVMGLWLLYSILRSGRL